MRLPRSGVAVRAATSTTAPPTAGTGGGEPSTLVLGTAINIASAAVEAYMDPKDGRQYRCTGSNGTTTQFIGSGAVVTRHLKAILQFMSKPDLYVKVSTGDSYAETPKAPNTRAPSFPDPLFLYPNLPNDSSGAAAPSPLTVRVFDDDSVAWTGRVISAVRVILGRLGIQNPLDDPLGSGTVELPADWESSGTTQHTVEIVEADGKRRGTVTLSLTAAPLSDTGFKAAAEPSLKEDLRASVKAAFANPGLALAQGTPVDLQKHVAAAAVLHPVIASLAAGPTNPTVAAEGAKPLTVAVTAAADGAAVADAAAPADPEGGVTLEEAKSLVRKAWAKLPEAFPDAFLVDGEPVAFLSSTYDAQLWIHRNEKLKQVVLAFRGTQGNNGFDWLTDALVLQAKAAKDPVTGGLRTVGDLGDGAEPDGGKGIHTGFYRAYRSVEPQMRQVLAMCTAGEPGWTITTTGHSLGGGLATICAYDLATSSDFDYNIESFTFGSPRPGNAEFAAAYDACVPATFRFHNEDDIVAQVPWFLGYSHVKSQARLDNRDAADTTPSGLLYLPEANPISVFGKGTLSSEIHEHVVAPPGRLDGARFFRQRLLLFRALFTGRGAASHSFDEYVLSLANVMYTASDGMECAEAVKALRDALEAVRKAGEERGEEE